MSQGPHRSHARIPLASLVYMTVRRVVVLAPGRRRRVGVGVDFVCPRETVLGENLRFFGDAGRLDGA